MTIFDERGKEVNVKQELEMAASMTAAGVDVTEKMNRLERLLGPEYEKHVGAPGSIPNICSLLEKRRLEHKIPNGAFNYEAVFDRIYVWQIARNEGETFEGTSIVKPDIAQAREEEEAPRGIIVSAGLAARDVLVSNGMDVGHIINFLKLSPMRMVVGMVSAIPIHLLMMRVGDISGSEDLAQHVRSGTASVLGFKNSHGAVIHKLVDPNSTEKATDMAIAPKLPWMTSDH